MVTDAKDARQAMEDMEDIAEKARRLERYKGADILFLVWGVAWTIAFLTQHFFGRACVRFGAFSGSAGGLAWFIAVPLAILASWLLGRKRFPTTTPNDEAIGVLWGMTFAFFAGFFVVLSPVLDHARLNSVEGERLLTAAISLAPMFAWVVMGLFLNNARYLVWLGLAIAAANVFGVFALGHWYFLWMAFAGGGVMIAAGVVTRRAWRKA